MNMLRTEWAKLAPMTFTEKRQYIWEYYKLHMLAIVVITILVGSILNTMIFNPPRREYVYFVWVGPPVTTLMLDDFAYELNVIVENYDRYVVRATNYNIEGLDPQMIMGLQTRFFAKMQQQLLDFFILTEDWVYEYSTIGFILPMMYFLDEVRLANPELHVLMTERLIEVTYYPIDNGMPRTDCMAVSLRGVAFFDKFYIQTDDLYLAIVINAERFERAIRALEVIFDV